ncbi:hypothetical protein [Roseicella sp. DB1501]|uniref:hypothetical protein n=1 Tax=Roseicella sp. DB1501 TaxID=2730925 RepID=UPI00149107DD|nr:hypothetical protein [Roseicella sp. DB1501]NOG70488.1 hypothetical protein [Roseicella sp. DB1501]
MACENHTIWRTRSGRTYCMHCWKGDASQDEVLEHYWSVAQLLNAIRPKESHHGGWRLERPMTLREMQVLFRDEKPRSVPVPLCGAEAVWRAIGR